jgi:hypothetical protein
LATNNGTFRNCGSAWPPIVEALSYGSSRGGVMAARRIESGHPRFQRVLR